MKRNRVWIEIVLLGSAIAFALALLMATLGAAAGALGTEQAAHARSERVYVGMISCSRCGSRHAPALSRTAETCTRVCVHGGASFSLVGADMTYLLDGDSNVLKTMAGRRARVRGTLSQNNLSQQTIKVSSVATEI
jgi:hypothetical protein